MSVLAGAIVIATAGGCGSSAPAHGTGGNDGAVDVPPDGLYVPPPVGRIDTLLDDRWRFLRANAAGADHIFIFPAVPLVAGDNPATATATRGAVTATDGVTWTRQ